MASADLSKKLRQLKESLAFWPFILSFLGAAVGWALPILDRQLSTLKLSSFAWAMLHFEAPSGIVQVLLSSAASTLATVLGVVFSLTIVTLQLASVQYSPRLLPRFMADRTTQRTLGAYLGTVIYLFMVLRSVRGGAHPFVPEVSVTLGLLLSVFCLVLIAYFLHHLALSIQAAHLIASVGREAAAGLIEHARSGVDSRAAVVPDEPCATLGSTRAGYVQIINCAQLLAAAPSGTNAIQLLCRPGDFLLAGQPTMRIWTGSSLSDRDRLGLSSALALGSSRTIKDDPLLGVRQLVDVALKALSPGINDVTTALLVVNELGTLLLSAAKTAPARPGVCAVQHGGVLLLAPAMDLSTTLDEALGEIPSAALGQPRILARIFEVLTEVLRQVPRADSRAVLLEMATCLWETAAHSSVHRPGRTLVEVRWQRLLRATARDSRDSGIAPQQVH